MVLRFISALDESNGSDWDIIVKIPIFSKMYM